MIEPELNEAKQAFIKRGLKDEVLTTLYPDDLERLKYLGHIFDSVVENEDFEKRFKHILKGEKGEKGIDGLNGKDGNTPKKGIDYFTNDEITSIVSDVLKQIKIPEPQIIDKTVTVQVPAELTQETVLQLISDAIANANIYIDGKSIKRELESLRGDDRLDASAIKNLPQPVVKVYGGRGGNDQSSNSVPSWGNITGNLTDQTDLQTLLDSKVNSTDLNDVATTGDYNDLINAPFIPDVLDDLSDIQFSLLTEGDVLTWDGVDNKWKNVAPSITPETLYSYSWLI